MVSQACAASFLDATMKHNEPEASEKPPYVSIQSENTFTMSIIDDPSENGKKCVSLDIMFDVNQQDSGSDVVIVVDKDFKVIKFSSKTSNQNLKPDPYFNSHIQAKVKGNTQVIMKLNEEFDPEKEISENNCPALFEATKFETSYELTERTSSKQGEKPLSREVDNSLPWEELDTTKIALDSDHSQTSSTSLLSGFSSQTKATEQGLNPKEKTSPFV